MSSYLLDSGVIIWFLRGRSQTVELLGGLSRTGDLGCYTPSIIEVMVGARKKEEEVTQDFLHQLKLYPVGEQVALLAAEYIIQFPAGQQSCIRGDPVAVKLQSQPAVELKLQCLLRLFTH